MLLLWAAWCGHQAIVGLLLERGKADANGNYTGSETLLMWAARNGREAIVKLLLENGANIKARDEDG